MRRIIGLVVAVAALSAPLVGRTEPGPSRQRPQGPASANFGVGFPVLNDTEWNFRLGGFGGTTPGAARNHAPVIFVHGNNTDAGDWYPVRAAFRAAGWNDQELWAISNNGLGSSYGTGVIYRNPEADNERLTAGWDGGARITENDINVADLTAFILAVRTYTGSDKFSLVGHSLGVTMARKVLWKHPELRKDLIAFVGIAGANHGTSFCPPGSEGNVVSCNEIAAGTDWLRELNGADGSDETYPPAKWMTVFDGTGLGDPAFAGPTYANSPALLGADNRVYPLAYHNDLRLDPAIIDDYREFIEQAEDDA